MQIDDAGQHQEVARVKRKRTAGLGGADRADCAVGDQQRSVHNLVAKQRPAALNNDIGHDRTLRRRSVAREADDVVSYFSRNSSISSFLKSGRAAWSAS